VKVLEAPMVMAPALVKSPDAAEVRLRPFWIVNLPAAPLVVKNPCRISLPPTSAMFAEAPSSRMVAALVAMTAPVPALACESWMVPEKDL
jgi:hypothetical protein